MKTAVMEPPRLPKLKRIPKLIYRSFYVTHVMYPLTITYPCALLCT